MPVIEVKNATFMTAGNEERLYVDYAMDGIEGREFITHTKFFGWMKSRYPTYYSQFKNFFGMPAPTKFVDTFSQGSPKEKEEAQRIMTEYLTTQCNLPDPRNKPDIRTTSPLMQTIFDKAKQVRNDSKYFPKRTAFTEQYGNDWILQFAQEAKSLGLGQTHFWNDYVNSLYIYPPFTAHFSDSKNLQAFNNTIIGQQRAIAMAQEQARTQAQAQKPRPPQPAPTPQPVPPKQKVILDNSQVGVKKEEKKDDKLFRRIRSGNNPFR